MNVRLELIYHEIARMVLLHRSDEEIAQRTGLKPKGIKSILQKPDFRQILDALRTNSFVSTDKTIENQNEDLATRIRADATESYDRLLSLLRGSQSESIQRDVAQDLLDRAGYAKQDKSQAPVIVFGPMEAGALIEALKREEAAHLLNKDKDLPGLAKPVREGLDERRSNASEGPTPSPSS